MSKDLIRHCLPVCFAVLLSACVHPDFNALPQSTGPITSGEKLTAVKVVLFRPTALPVRITGTGRSSGQDTGAGKSANYTVAKSLADDFARDVAAKFPALAERYGVKVVQESGALPILQLSIVRYDLGCYDNNCIGNLVVDSDVFNPSGQFVWHTQSSLGALAGDGKLHDAAFDLYVQRLFETMRRDDLISAN
jgi:hypothetical protein